MVSPVAYSTMANSHYIYQYSLRRLFGLTEEMVDALGPPDVAPSHDTAFGAAQYSLARVEEWIDANIDKVSQVWATYQVAEDCTDRHQEMMSWVDSAPIESLSASWEVWLDARASWSQLTFDRKISFIRHNLTNYYMLVKQLDERSACCDAYKALRKRVDSTIREWLLQP